jgi:DNA-binding transcriptional regulator GbsR (MarR family)
MGSAWGVSRSVAQIHALLFLSARPLTAEEIADMLGLARSNVSTSIRELLAWSLIRRVPVRGDRRDHFEAETDLWEIVLRIAAGRKARELDPALVTLEACVKAADGDRSVPALARKRLEDMLELVQALDRWHAQMIKGPKPQVAALIRFGSRVVSLLSRWRAGGARAG